MPTSQPAVTGRFDLRDPDITVLCVPGGSFLLLRTDNGEYSYKLEENECYSEGLKRHAQEMDRQIDRLKLRRDEILKVLRRHNKM